MATLKEYFEKDGSRTFCAHKPLQIMANGELCLEVIGRVHLDFDANAKYISYYIPSGNHVQCPARVVLNSVDELLSTANQLYVGSGFVGEEPMKSTTLQFTGRIFIYSEDPILQDDIAYIQTRAAELGHHVQFRLKEYAEKRNQLERPLAFISHDSRDKNDIARPLALELQKLMCPVWYDEFSLKVGSSLRESIENGLKTCKKCILILTPNFLGNGGWAKREYDSIFTRELVEQRNVILPVWFNVSQRDIYDYSPVLADRVASKWERGVEVIAKELNQVLNS
jgi:hypothetical protein